MTSFDYDLVLLDRDGVINKDLRTSVRSWADFEFIPSSLEAIVSLCRKNLKIALVTNQAVVGRGEISLEILEDIHQKMLSALDVKGGHLDQIYQCIDTTIEPNNRRKPAPGMLLEAFRDFNVHPQRTLMVGDALRDFKAAQRAGCDFALVRTGKGLMTEQEILKAPRKLPVNLRGIYDDLEAVVLNIFP
ncbi:MAG: HAD-IIIA family hydrolase [Alphaproteobacteria bacterium]|nr:HAD-IIIA family hydrolase [Alphaproteobacteria bacterium]NCQ67330.1 HAD-IIIA family hydrolase [Alphaproteobacteria bacterium]NCT06703.1 HAD-IIIA family hydrolase [Alphaproteobacteria bacterium]